MVKKAMTMVFVAVSVFSLPVFSLRSSAEKHKYDFIHNGIKYVWFSQYNSYLPVEDGYFCRYYRDGSVHTPGGKVYNITSSNEVIHYYNFENLIETVGSVVYSEDGEAFIEFNNGDVLPLIYYI